jgi:hypothetical protein
MNERNVEALANIMYQPEFLAKWSFGMTSREVAEHFASRGVLVPSALTATDVIDVIRAPEETNEPVREMTRRLERIAKGEA